MPTMAGTKEPMGDISAPASPLQQPLANKGSCDQGRLKIGNTSFLHRLGSINTHAKMNGLKSHSKESHVICTGNAVQFMCGCKCGLRLRIFF